jgi:hypothetical protein
MDHKLQVLCKVSIAVSVAGIVMLACNWLFNDSFEGLLFTCGRVAAIAGVAAVAFALSMHRLDSM